MRTLEIGILDLVSQCPTSTMWARVMYANFASIMPQAIATWCKEAGHKVTYQCYTGSQDLVSELPDTVDLVFIGAFTEAAQLAYALSNRLRSRGAVTVLGGPHARCYPQDAQHYFDYVLGFTDTNLIRDVLADCSPHRPMGIHLSAASQPSSIPGVRERWEFIEPTLRKAPFIKIVPMLGSLGCPYHCDFCIDSTVPFRPLDTAVLKDDLSFLLKKFKRPLVAFHDPNFGVQFDNCMDAIEDAVPPGRVDFIAESSLSLLSERHLVRLRRNGFKAMLPGIESWYSLGEKSRATAFHGMGKVREVSEHINTILQYIPYLQTNFVLGLDGDAGDEPFDLTKRFIDLSPGAFPGYSLLSAFGQAAPLNLRYQEAGRIVPFPFHFLNNNGAMNIVPKNYSWPSFYRHVIDLTRYSFSTRSILRRAHATPMLVPKWLNAIRALSSEGQGRIRYYSEILRRLEGDREFRRFFEQETATVPQFYIERMRQDLGPMWHWLPDGALQHDPNAFLRSTNEENAERKEACVAS